MTEESGFNGRERHMASDALGLVLIPIVTLVSRTPPTAGKSWMPSLSGDSPWSKPGSMPATTTASFNAVSY